MSDTKGPERPVGQLFSQVYLRTEDVRRDDPRFRVRVLMATNHRLLDGDRISAQKLTRRLGVRCYPLNTFFEKAPIELILDSITIIVQEKIVLYIGNFIDEIREILYDLQMAYEIDEQGGIHPRIDADFQMLKISTICALGGERFKNTRERFEAACDELKEDGQTGDAIDRTFRAAENLFKQLFPKEPRLTAASVTKCLLPRVQAAYEESKPAKRSAGQMCASFADWVDAAHWYRHEQGEPAPAPPPLDYAILMVNQGAGYLRWLAQNFDALRDRGDRA